MDNTGTRELIIDESYKLFIRNSYEAVSISDISQRIGLTKGALYHHFKNKEEIFTAVIDKYLRIDALEGDLNISLKEFIGKVKKLAKEMIRKVITEEVPFLPINHLSLLIDAFRHYPDFTRDNQKFFDNEIDKIKQVIRNAVKNGEIRKDIDINIASLNLMSISVGIAVNMFHQNSTKKATEIFESQLNEFYKLLKI